MAEENIKAIVLSCPPQWRGRINKAIRAAVQAEREACAKYARDNPLLTRHELATRLEHGAHTEPA